MKLWLGSVSVVIALLLLSCAPPPLVNSPPPEPIDDTPSVRPDIPRTPKDDIPEYQNPGEQPSGNTPAQIFLNNSWGERGVTFEIPLGDELGEHFPILTSFEFPLLRHAPIRVHDNFIAGYREEILFDLEENSTGRILFTKDDDDSIGTFLFFEEDKHIFEYRAYLDYDVFPNIQGREIQILGHTYVIAEASNSSVVLYGVDIASELLFQNNSKLRVNGSIQPDTHVKVYPDFLSFTLIADDPDESGILLSPGERLSDNIRQNNLASELLDIKYLGAPMLEAATISFDRSSFGYRLHIPTIDGRQLTIKLVEDNGDHIVIGTVENPLKYKKCPRGLEHCIEEEDAVLFTAPEGETHVLRFSGVSDESSLLRMRTDTDRYSYEVLGDFNRSNAWTDIIIDDWAFRADISDFDNITNSYNISVQQGFEQDRVEIVTLGGFIIRIGDVIDNVTLPLELVVPREFTLDRKEEVTPFNLTYDKSSGDWVIHVGSNFTFVDDEYTGDEFGITPYGVSFWLDKEGESLPDREGIEMEILIPSETMFGSILIEG